MTTLPLADCSRMLGIHPKTLHHWLKQADVPLAAHPTDARIKCVTEEHVQQLARLHRRPLQFPLSASASASALPEGACALGSSEGQAPPSQANEAQPLHTVRSLLTSFPQEADLIQKLSSLETRIVTLQEQLAQLALALLQERERTVEQRITTLESLVQQLVGRQMLPDLQARGAGQESAVAPHQPRQLNPAEQRARSRMPPLIEYAATGLYVIVSSQEGELHLSPDSVEWFDWLATLSSFRFVGQAGRFTAYRDSDRQGPTRSWRAHRTIHQHRYQHCLGVTDRLTIVWLEQVAAKFQAYVDAP
jgi:DNA-binding transcriptional MerR regulator